MTLFLNFAKYSIRNNFLHIIISICFDIREHVRARARTCKRTYNKLKYNDIFENIWKKKPFENIIFLYYTLFVRKRSIFSIT